MRYALAWGDTMEGFGERLRKERKKAKLTQEQLAEMIDMSHAFIGHLERGTRIPSVETVVRLCRALGIGSDRLLGI